MDGAEKPARFVFHFDVGDAGKVQIAIADLQKIHNRIKQGQPAHCNPAWQRTAVNTEAKLLLLTHAFETWKCIRVELKTDALNEQSRNAILRLGAKQEGIFRNHLITETGRFRDSVYFSIIDSEWESVRAKLTSKLAGSK